MTQSQLLELLSALPPPARLGETLGKYRLERIVAAGGMGVVVEATNLRLDQRVAIKFMSPQLATEDTSVRRFLQEARSAARIRSEHVVRVFDADTLETGTPYIVMELLEGEDLSVMLERRGWLPPSEAVDYVLQACEAIAEAHRLGIVHRDLKPGNLFWCKRPDKLPFIKVLDFGVSKLLPRAQIGSVGRDSTGPVAVMGTPMYASPEQLRSSTEVDVRTDIWALGVILYELIAGKPPFRAGTLFELRAKIAKAPLQPLHELRPDVPEKLCAVVAKCLAKERDERYATVADFAEALAPHAPRSSLLSVRRVGNILRTLRGLERTLPSATGRKETPAPPSGVAANRGATRRHPRWAVTLGSLAGGIVGAAVLAAWAVSARVPRSAEAGAAPASLRSARDLPATSVLFAGPPSERMEASSQEPAGREPVPVTSTAPASATGSTAPTTRPSHPRPARGTEQFGGLL
jgi:serine/threonine-protein kinase